MRALLVKVTVAAVFSDPKLLQSVVKVPQDSKKSKFLEGGQQER